jgi:hypothetical protein
MCCLRPLSPSETDSGRCRNDRVASGFPPPLRALGVRGLPRAGDMDRRSVGDLRLSPYPNYALAVVWGHGASRWGPGNTLAERGSGGGTYSADAAIPPHPPPCSVVYLSSGPARTGGVRWSCHREQNYESRVSSSSAPLSHSRPGCIPVASGSDPAPRPRLPTPIVPRRNSWRRDPSLPCRSPRVPGRTAARDGRTGAAHSPGVFYHHRLRPTRPEHELDSDIHVPFGRSPGDVRVPSRRQRL